MTIKQNLEREQKRVIELLQEIIPLKEDGIRLQAENAALKARLAEMREVLKEVEWNGQKIRGLSKDDATCLFSSCPYCSAADENGHAPDCRLARAIREE